MTSANSMASSIPLMNLLDVRSVQERVNKITDDFLSALPSPAQFTSSERRGMIARYAAVLEGNFIYWMTGAYLSTRTDEARSIILDNLREEIGDCHPAMMRRFAIAAHAVPTESDVATVYHDLSSVRMFVGRLSSVPMVVMMAFFEGLIQKFMPYLADLAARQGSQEMEYTDVHGVCDIAHTAGLYQALEAEAALSPLEPSADPFEGVLLLRTLLETIVFGRDRLASVATH